jgi:hypothetical protein
MISNTESRFAIQRNRANHWQDWAILFLAVWLFISPWVLSFGGSIAVTTPGAVGAVGNAAWNAWILGVIVFLVALSAVGRMEAWQEWINLLLGIWIFVAPWALGFVTGLAAASWDHWCVGALIFILAVSNLAGTRTSVPMQR